MRKAAVSGIIGFALILTGFTASLIPAHATACVTTSASGVCGPYTDPDIFSNNGGAEVVQDEWNPVSGASQSLTASAPGAWNVTASMPAGNRAVVGYPDVRIDYTPGDRPTPFTAFPAPFTSSWSEVDPAGSGQDYEWAYDIWIGDASQVSWTSDLEVMIWTGNHGQVPGGSDTGTAYTDSQGTSWEVWTRGGSNTVSQSFGTVTFVRGASATSGSIDLQGFLGYLTANGYVIPGAGIDQVGYGVELCSTGGASLDYAVTGYTLGGAAKPPPPPVPGGLSQTAHVLVNFGWHAPPGWTGGYEFDLVDTTGATVTDRAVPTTHVSSVLVAGDTTYEWRVRVTGGTWSGFRMFTSP